MSQNNTSDRMRRAAQLWHAYLGSTGLRFDLVQFLKDPALQKQILDSSLVSGDSKLVAMAQEWLRDPRQAAPAAPATRAAPVPQAAPEPPPAEVSKPSRYMYGVR